MASLFDGLPATEPSAGTGFAGNLIDRRSEKRGEDSIATALADATARLYLFRGDKALLKGDDPLFVESEAGDLGAFAHDVVLLGWSAEGPRLAATLPEAEAIDETQIRLIDLRSLAIEGAIGTTHLGAIAQGRSLTGWNARHRFCSVCGHATELKIGGYRRDCPSCKAEHFPRTDPVVIMLALDSAGDRCLLGRQPRFAPSMYSCLAGFLEPGETIEDAVRRETFEESGIRVRRVRYHASQPWPFPSSLMIGCHAEAVTTEIVRDAAELEDCRWFPRDEVRAMLAGTHSGGIKCPPTIAIANRIIAAWAEAS